MNPSNEIVDEDNSIAILLTGDDIDYDPLTYIVFQNPINVSKKKFLIDKANKTKR